MVVRVGTLVVLLLGAAAAADPSCACNSRSQALRQELAQMREQLKELRELAFDEPAAEEARVLSADGHGRTLQARAPVPALTLQVCVCLGCSSAPRGGVLR
jgi:hypothetical protein